MADTAKRDSQEMRYLLGSLSEDERNRLEEGFFADDAKFEELEVLEDELIDGYVSGELSPDQRRQFESKLRTSPRLVERVHFARALAERVNSSLLPEPEPAVGPAASLVTTSELRRGLRKWSFWTPAFTSAMAVCAVLMLVAGVVLISGWLRLRNEAARLAADRAALQQQREGLNKLSVEQRNSAEEAQAKLQQEKNQLAEDRKLFEEAARALHRELGSKSLVGPVASILLSPGSLRSTEDDTKELTLRRDTPSALLKLELENNEYRRYNFSVQAQTGKVVYSARDVKPLKTTQGPLLVISIPRRLLSSDDYRVDISGRTSSGKLEKVNYYQFHVIEKP